MYLICEKGCAGVYNYTDRLVWTNNNNNNEIYRVSHGDLHLPRYDLTLKHAYI